MTGQDKFEHRYKILSVLRVLLGLFFLGTGVWKLTDMQTFVDSIARFFIFPINTEEWVACLGIAAELVVAYCFLMRVAYQGALVMALVMTGSYVAIFVQGWWRGLSLSCNCLGFVHKVTNYPFDIGWRVLLFLAVLALFWEIKRSQDPFFFDRSKRLS